MLKLIFNKDYSLFFEEKSFCHLEEHLKKMTPNSNLQFIHKESGNSMTKFCKIAQCQIVATLAPVYGGCQTVAMYSRKGEYLFFLLLDLNR